MGARAVFVTQPCATFDVSQRVAIADTQPLVRLDVAQPKAVLATQPMLRVLVFKSVSAHRETVTDNGEVITFDGEEVWIMVPDA
jgi:hypothetical protein